MEEMEQEWTKIETNKLDGYFQEDEKE